MKTGKKLGILFVLILAAVFLFVGQTVHAVTVLPPTFSIPIDSVHLAVTEPSAGESPSYVFLMNGVPHYSAYDYDTLFFKDGVRWKDITTGVAMSVNSGTFTAGHTYEISIMLEADDGYKFTENTTAFINGNAATTSLSNGRLTVSYTFPALHFPGPVLSPFITTQPTSQTAAVGTTAVLKVVASGTAPLSYQWQYKNKSATEWNNASGTTATWNLTVAAVHYGFDFRCKVTDASANAAYSDVVQINNPNPTLTITQQPTDKTAAVGTTAVMKVAASGTGTLSYQWQYKNKTAATWNNASGKTATWNLTVAAVHYNFDFRCKVSDTYGNVKYSNVVHINPSGMPSLTITQQPTDKTAAVGTTAVMKVAASGTGTLSYQWQYKQKTASTWNNASGKTATWNLTVAAVHYNFDFRCKVSDTYGNVKYSNTVHINPSGAPSLTITTQPTTQTVAIGAKANLTVAASGTGTLTYQWQYKQRSSSTWNNASGKTATWNLTVAEVHYGFDFRCKVSDTYGNVKYSNTVQIKPQLSITTQPANKTAAVGETVTMSIGASGTGLTYQWQYKQRSSSTWNNASGKTAVWNLTVYAVHFGYDFRCVVTDKYGNSINSVTVRINSK